MSSKGDERFLHIPLMLSERCWSYAMQLRQESNTEPRKKFHLVQKLRKACIYSMQLEELCKVLQLSLKVLEFVKNFTNLSIGIYKNGLF